MEPGQRACLVGVTAGHSDQVAAPVGLCEGRVCGGQGWAGLQHPLDSVEDRAGDRINAAIAPPVYAQADFGDGLCQTLYWQTHKNQVWDHVR